MCHPNRSKCVIPTVADVSVAEVTRVPPLLQLLRPAAAGDLRTSMDANLHVDAHGELLGTSQLLRPSRLENMRTLPER